MSMSTILENFRERFQWESKEQEKGFGNLVQYLTKRAKYNNDSGLVMAAYFIQKDHESNEYWTELVGNQIGLLQQEIKRLQDELAQVKARLNQ